MKKSIIFSLSVLFMGTAWADNCEPTTDMLHSGGSYTYDDYLYPDSQSVELRAEGKKSEAYLCGTGYCGVGTKIRLQNALVGSQRASQDAVYECINTSTSGRTSFQWEIHEVQQTCNVRSPQIATQVSESDVRNAGTLFEYDGDYCKRAVTSSNVTVNAKTNFWDTANTFLSESNQTIRTGTTEVGATVRNIFGGATNITVTSINGGVKLAGKFMDSSIKGIEIFKDGSVEIIKATGGTIQGIWKTTADGIVSIFDVSGKTVVGALKILTNGTVEILDSIGKPIVTLTKEAGETFRTFIQEAADVTKVAIQETGATVRNVFDNATKVTVESMESGVELVVNYSKERTNRIKIRADRTVEIAGEVGETIRGTWKTTTDGIVNIYATTGEIFIGGLKILKDGTVEIFKSTGATIQTIVKAKTEAYIATIKFFGSIIGEFGETARTAIIEGGKVVGIAIQEFGATVRNVFDNATKVTVESMESGVELVVNYSKERTNRIKIRADRTVEIAGEVGETIRGTWKTTIDGIVNIYATTGEVFIGGLRIVKDGTVEIFKSTGATIQTIAREKTKAYIATIKLFGDAINGFNENVKTWIIESGKVVGVTIQTAGAIIMNAMDNATDFAKHFTSEIIGGIQSLQINKARLKKLEEDIAKCQTQEQVAELIAAALREAELNDKQIAQVREMINEYAIEQNQHFEVIENKIKSLEQEIYEIQQQNIIFASQIAGLGVKYTNMQSQYNNLAAQVRTKVNAQQVVKLIYENTQAFTDGQKQELYGILDEYTRKLSDGQRAEVQGMIENYVNPLVRGLNTKINLESDRRVAESRVASAMSVLNAFAASADVSVWKNAEGKFNGARLASDSVAGVVLGTAGGLISNSLIKKSQTKKGFEDIHCTVGGQFVADYDDDFAVGIK